jgi:hypothetical protein
MQSPCRIWLIGRSGFESKIDRPPFSFHRKRLRPPRLPQAIGSSDNTPPAALPHDGSTSKTGLWFHSTLAYPIAAIPLEQHRRSPALPVRPPPQATIGTHSAVRPAAAPDPQMPVCRPPRRTPVQYPERPTEFHIQVMLEYLLVGSDP